MAITLVLIQSDRKVRDAFITFCAYQGVSDCLFVLVESQYRQNPNWRKERTPGIVPPEYRNDGKAKPHG